MFWIIKDKISEILNKIAIAIAVFVLFWFYIDLGSTMPSHADVYLNHINKKYISPPCIEDFYDPIEIQSNIDEGVLKLYKDSQIKWLGFEPDEQCRDSGWFVHNKSLIRYVIEQIWILEESNRWNDDGSWNW